jgi:uroporphyrinogen-III decarboxylase
MKHDWKASNERMAAVFSGETPDRVPLLILSGESTGVRISGLTVREMLSSPKKLAEVSLQTYEFLGTDNLDTVVPPYAGPMEALAFAKVNGKADKFVWFDYRTPHMPEGAICKTEKDIEDLEIPDHSRVEPFPTIFEATAILTEKTGVPPVFSPSLTWSNVQLLRGSQAYIDVLENPDLLLKVCEKIYASHIDFYKAFCKVCGKPATMFNCQYGFNRHMLSFEDAWKFEGQFVVRYHKETGLPLIVHNCGFEPYWDEMIEKFRKEGVPVLAVNGGHPLDVDKWVQFHEKFPDVVIMGVCLYVNDLIMNGTPEDVEERAKQVIAKLAPSNRLILSPHCTVDWRMPFPNIFALRDAVEKYGRYPIKVTA